MRSVNNRYDEEVQVIMSCIIFTTYCTFAYHWNNVGNVRWFIRLFVRSSFARPSVRLFGNSAGGRDSGKTFFSRPAGFVKNIFKFKCICIFMCPRWQLFFATLSERSKTFSQQRFLDCPESATKLALPKQVPAPRSNAKKKKTTTTTTTTTLLTLAPPKIFRRFMYGHLFFVSVKTI